MRILLSVLILTINVFGASSYVTGGFTQQTGSLCVMNTASTVQSGDILVTAAHFERGVPGSLATLSVEDDNNGSHTAVPGTNAVWDPGGYNYVTQLFTVVASTGGVTEITFTSSDTGTLTCAFAVFRGGSNVISASASAGSSSVALTQNLDGQAIFIFGESGSSQAATPGSGMTMIGTNGYVHVTGAAYSVGFPGGQVLPSFSGTTLAMAGVVVGERPTYTISGPSSGTVNQQSQNFILTNNSGGAITVEISDGGNTGVVHSSCDGMGVTPKPLTFSGASCTFTYTPSSVEYLVITAELTSMGIDPVPSSLNFSSRPQIGLMSIMTKVRPTTLVPISSTLAISAARNEFEAFQVVIGGGEAGITGVDVSITDFTGPGGATIPASAVFLYQEAMYNVVTKSGPDGAVGLWPDALIPKVDAFYGELRNFSFDVSPNETRAVWVELLVPTSAVAGDYTATVTVTGTGIADTDLTITLRVRNFTLPSTPSMNSIWMSDNCRIAGGFGIACDNPLLVKFGESCLDHRVSCSTMSVLGYSTIPLPGNVYEPLYVGTAGTRLAGARQQTLAFSSFADPYLVEDWRDYSEALGPVHPQVFMYTRDEPSDEEDFIKVMEYGAVAQSFGVPSMVTSNLYWLSCSCITGISPPGDSVLEYVDWLVPLIQDVYGPQPPYHEDVQGMYRSWEAEFPANQFWTYHACLDQGCLQPSEDLLYSGWPSYMIDATAIQNRAGEWFTGQWKAKGELYYQIDSMISTAWTDQFAFGGNGDGTLYYPGFATTALNSQPLIGGAHNIPIESMRLKYTREGVEDFEYMAILKQLGDEAFAVSTAAALFPDPHIANQTTPEDLYAARAALAARIEELQLTRTPGGSFSGGSRRR